MWLALPAKLLCLVLSDRRVDLFVLCCNTMLQLAKQIISSLKCKKAFSQLQKARKLWVLSHNVVWALGPFFSGFWMSLSETCELCVLCFLVTMFVHADIVCLHMLQLCCLVKQRDSPIRPLQHRLFKLPGQEGDFDPLSTSVSSSLAQQQNAQQNFPLAYKRGLGVLYLGIAWQIQQHEQC